MATGGIFQLITNDGKQDRMLMATDLLTQRLQAVRAQRATDGHADTTPTLYDIERTHILFTNAHFKPFAAIGYEYNKVNHTSGSASFGSKLTFSIPQFGDFFNDMVVHAVLTQPKFSDGNRDATAPSKQNLFRWCSYPGERLLKTVKFEVNGNPLDEYDRDAVNFHREFQVQPNKALAWDRCVGQEEDEHGFMDQPDWINSGVAAADVTYRSAVVGRSGNQTPSGVKTADVELFIPLLFWCNKDPRLAVPSVAIPYGQRFITMELASHQEMVGEVVRGHAESVSFSDAVGEGGGKLTERGNTAATVKSVELYINNIFVNPDVHNIFITRIGFTLIRVHRKQVVESTTTGDSLLLMNLKWPIESLFIGMRVKEHANSGESSAQYIDRWHSFCDVQDDPRSIQGFESDQVTETHPTALTTVLTVLAGVGAGLTSITFTAPSAGIPPIAVLAGGTPDARLVLSPGDVLKFALIAAPTVFYELVVNYLTATVITFRGDSVALGLTGAITTSVWASLVTKRSAEVSYTVQVCKPTLSSIAIKAHGIPIYGQFPTGFFNAYVPYNYGGGNISAPKDVGALMVTFCLYPGTYQPSGHINISRAREFYLDYIVTSAISPTRPGKLIVIASAINFLLISDGSAVLRYST